LTDEHFLRVFDAHSGAILLKDVAKAEMVVEFTTTNCETRLLGCAFEELEEYPGATNMAVAMWTIGDEWTQCELVKHRSFVMFEDCALRILPGGTHIATLGAHKITFRSLLRYFFKK
jgi:hypothetical protein